MENGVSILINSYKHKYSNYIDMIIFSVSVYFLILYLSNTSIIISCNSFIITSY